MRRPGEAVGAAVLATAVWVDARLEADVGAVVPRDDRLRAVAKELRLQLRPFVCSAVTWLDRIELDVEFLEPVADVSRCSTPAQVVSCRRPGMLAELQVKCLTAAEIMFRHVLCSTERLALSSTLSDGRRAETRHLEGWSSG